MESTAHYWLVLYTRLKKDEVVILNPIQTHTMQEMFLRKSKTDAKDSLVIAEVIRFGRYAAGDVSQEKLLEIKELCSNRSYLMGLASDLKRKTVALPDRVFPEYETQFDSIFCKSSRAVLNKYPTAQKLANANLSKLTELLWTSSNGHFGEWKAQEIKVSFQQFDTTLTSIPGIGAILTGFGLGGTNGTSRVKQYIYLQQEEHKSPQWNGKTQLAGFLWLGK